ncbi:hypothetical protein ACFLYR_04755 [Chloroflexota bacterium]
MRERLANKLAQLVELFRKGKAAADSKWWNENSSRSIFYPLYGYQDGEPLFEEIVKGTMELNSNMLSRIEVERKTMFDFLQKETINVTKHQHHHNQRLIGEANDFINEMERFETWQDVDVPIANLWHNGEPVSLGYVTFMAINEGELEQWKSKPVMWPEKAPDVRVLVRIRAPGDKHRALQYTRTQVDLVLDVLRACCFPFGRNSDTWKIGVVGDIIASTSTPMRINNREYVTQLGASTAQIELKRILRELSDSQLDRINRLITKTHTSNMENKLLTCIHWLAESTKQDTTNAKFAKIGFALETLIGSEPHAVELKVRGITAMLAERAAFIGGENLDDRLDIDRQIRTYYGMRSDIVHGGAGDVTLEDIDGFGELTRRLVFSVLTILDRFGEAMSNVDELEAWVKRQRYTLPDSI